MAPRDPTTIALPRAQGMVEAIWSDMSLRYPPEVERLPRHATATLARASRLTIYLPEQTPSWCLLHEIAHAMTTTAEGHSEGHGPDFMGLYVKLLVRYLRLDEADLLSSLRQSEIRVAHDANPVFVDR